MSFFTGTLYSDALHMDTNLGAILPQDSRLHRYPALGIAPGVKPRAKPKTFILLHGLSDNYSVWEHRTSLLRYAEFYDAAILLPEAQRSFFLDMKNGPAYFTYIAEELPKLASELFNISVTPQDLYIGGLSMGGYGAMLAALTHPEKYAGAGCLSGAYDIKGLAAMSQVPMSDPVLAMILAGMDKDMRAIFGEDYKVPDSADLFTLVPKAAKSSHKPDFYLACGTEDFLYQANTAARDALKAAGFKVTYEEWPGIHEWGFWDTAIQKMLKHFIAP
jgi:S-formylglutathione hydrolase FrmB